MTPETFRERLRALDLSQAGFARKVSDLGGETFSARTVQDWAQGRRAIPATVPALLTLLEHEPA